MDEVRFAIRRLIKQRGATIASVVTLSVAIAFAAATWTLLSAVLIRPLPVKDPDRLVVAGSTGSREPGVVYDGFIYPVFPVVRESNIFEQVAAQWTPPHVLVSRVNGGSAMVRVGFASFNFFDVLGVPIIRGRGFAEADDRRGAPPVAILTNRFWRLAFGSRQDVVGETLSVAGKTVTIVGIAPVGFRGLNLAQSVDLYLPLNTIGDVGSQITNYFADSSRSSSPTAGLRLIGRLRDGESIEQTIAKVRAIKTPPGETISVLTPIDSAAVPFAARRDVAQFSRLLGVTVGLLLFIGCATVGMLVLVRTEARRDEFAICAALGARASRLARGVAIEGCLLAVTGAALSIPLARWVFTALSAFQLPGAIDIGLLELQVSSRSFAAIAGAGAAASVAIALIAGTFGFRVNPSDGLRSRAGATPRVTRRYTRAVLVSAQVAVALLLTLGAGLFARSLVAALKLNSTLDMSRLVTGNISLAAHGYNPARASVFFQDFHDRLRTIPSIHSAAFYDPQGAMTPLGKIVIDGVPHQFPSPVSFTAVSPDYFRTMGIRIAGGRDFSDDDRANAPLVAIVSESLGRALTDGGNAVGRRITMPFSRNGGPANVLAVAGIVEDVVTDISVLEPLAIYFPLAQASPNATSLSVAFRATSTPTTATREVLNAIRQIDPSIIPPAFVTLQERIARQMNAQQFGAMVLSALGVMTLLLTALSTYVVAESMSKARLREMGIRAALGATGAQLGTIVLAETTRLVVAGLLVGLALSWLGANTIRVFLFQVAPLDPVTVGVAVTIILSVGLLVSTRPALRAASVDLASVLKEQ